VRLRANFSTVIFRAKKKKKQIDGHRKEDQCEKLLGDTPIDCRKKTERRGSRERGQNKGGGNTGRAFEMKLIGLVTTGAGRALVVWKGGRRLIFHGTEFPCQAP